jgi:hypothetical protein
MEGQLARYASFSAVETRDNHKSGIRPLATYETTNYSESQEEEEAEGKKA